MGGRVLIAGMSWLTQSIHTKGFDSYSTASFNEGYSGLRDALEAGGHAVDVIEGHAIPDSFPTTLGDLQRYATIIIADVGANTFLLTAATWRRGEATIDRLQLLTDYVRGGGGLAMAGGYLSFAGIEGKGFWAGTPVADVLPVTMLRHDDRVEVPEGVQAIPTAPGHKVLAGVDGGWPALLGYNRTTAKAGANVIARVAQDPLLVLGTAQAGRTAAFMSSCSPHWCPQNFIAWSGYAAMWRNICSWTAGEI